MRTFHSSAGYLMGDITSELSDLKRFVRSYDYCGLEISARSGWADFLLWGAGLSELGGNKLANGSGGPSSLFPYVVYWWVAAVWTRLGLLPKVSAQSLSMGGFLRVLQYFPRDLMR